MRTVLAGACAIMSVVVLLRSAALKAVGLSRVRATLSGLGVPSTLVGALSLGLPALELTVALLVVVTSSIGATAVLFLGLLFAATGSIALLTRRRVHCACFGTVNSHPLGWRQLLALPIWFAVVIGIRCGHAPAVFIGTAGLALATTSLIPPLWNRRRSSGQDRLATSPDRPFHLTGLAAGTQTSLA